MGRVPGARASVRAGVSAALALLLGAALACGRPVEADGGRRPGPPVVVDAEGREVGRLLAGRVSSLSGEVEIRVGDVVAAVTIWGHRVTIGKATVAFLANDCTGPPLLVVPSAETAPPFLFRLTGVGPGDLVLVDAGPVATLPIGSTYRSNQAVPACGAPFNPVEDVVPAALLLDLNAFTPPFKVR